MKPLNLFKKTAFFALVLGLIMGMTQRVYAAGVPSGVLIANTAVVDYKVNNIPQIPIESAPTGNSLPGNGSSTNFVVDNKVDFTVVTQDPSPVSVTPGGIDYYLTFLVTNTGNTTQDYALSAYSVRQGGATKFNNQLDEFNMDNVIVRVDNGDGYYHDANDTVDFIDELAADANVIVFIIADAPTSARNNEYASYRLMATARNAGKSGLGKETDETEGADTVDSVDVVFADLIGSNDANRDGKLSDQDDYRCISSILTIKRTSVVISDPINGASSPERIRGAIVEHVIRINNAAGAAMANDIIVSHSLEDEIGAGAILFNPYGYAINHGIVLIDRNSTTITLSNAADGDQGDFGGTNTNTVTVMGISLAGGESAIVKFKVIVQ